MLKSTSIDFKELAQKIKRFGASLGFQQVGIADTNLDLAEQRLQQWLSQKFHGDMSYMEHHGTKRSRPQELCPDVLRIIVVRMNYLPPHAQIEATLKDQQKAYISRYALGRDYHKVLRKRLTRLAKFIATEVTDHRYRIFVDSAPVMEKPLAEKAGLGWIGKSTNLTNTKAGSWFFLGTLYTNLPLPIDAQASNHCGSCKACLEICPTQAIIAPYQLDAKRCISYLTIEYHGIIPEDLRPLMGNRIYGCDDCQLICPWNKFAKTTAEKDFYPRHELDSAKLISLFNWSEEEFLKKTEGSAIRRIGYQNWLRNLSIALGNAPYDPEIIAALTNRFADCTAVVREHIQWALAQQNRSRTLCCNFEK